MTALEIDKIRGNNPLLALQCAMHGLQLLTRKELRKFLLWPLLVNLLLYTAALVLSYIYIGDLLQQFIPGWLHWLNWILWPLFFICFFAGSFFTFTLLGNLIAAPFYGLLAQRAAEIIAGQPHTAVEAPWTKAVWAEGKRVIYILTRSLPLLLLFLIPGVNLIAPLLWALFGAWCMALEYLAYPLENQGLVFTDQRIAMRKARLGAITLGGLTMLGLTLPGFNILVPPAAVIAATAYVQKIRK
ncbi:MAG: sulfate transporter CysZ [Gammaproteobacteria bacterium]